MSIQTACGLGSIGQMPSPIFLTKVKGKMQIIDEKVIQKLLYALFSHKMRHWLRAPSHQVDFLTLSPAK
jgi:hypothetical protein